MSRIRFHQLAALVVLIGFAGWVATGKFSSVGSASAEAEQAKAAVAQAPPQVRTVAVVAPPHIQHARAIRMSGQTEANQRASLAVRSNGVIDRIMVKQGDRVKPGELILALAAEEKTAAIEMARQVLLQRQAEADAAERLVKTGSMAKLQADNARSGLATARSLLEAATAEVTRNEVRAPFDGVVDRVPVETGSSVMQGALVATILNLDPILAVGEVQRARPRLSEHGRRGRDPAGQRPDRQGQGALHQPGRLAADPHLPHRGRHPQWRRQRAGRNDGRDHAAGGADRCRDPAALGGHPQQER